jgi:hypothetical protein
VRAQRCSRTRRALRVQGVGVGVVGAAAAAGRVARAATGGALVLAEFASRRMNLQKKGAGDAAARGRGVWDGFCL